MQEEEAKPESKPSKERETETHKNRDTEREGGRDRDTETHAQIERERQRQTEKERPKPHKGLPTLDKFLMKRCHPERNGPLSLPASLRVSPGIKCPKECSIETSPHGGREKGGDFVGTQGYLE